MHVKYFGGLKGGVPLYYLKKICGCHFIESAYSNYDSLQFIHDYIMPNSDSDLDVRDPTESSGVNNDLSTDGAVSLFSTVYKQRV